MFKLQCDQYVSLSKQRDTLERVGYRNCVIVLSSNSNFHGVVKETLMLINMVSTELLSYKKIVQF